jgi:hypothetical protein
MSALRVESTLIAAAPLLCGGRVEELIERSVDGHCELKHPVIKAHGSGRQLSRGSSKERGVRRGGSMRCAITTH